MRIIIIGLGNYGSTLGIELSKMGHEVIGVDHNMEKVESFKDAITHTICMDSANRAAIQTLPLKDTDLVVVAIGEDTGASIMATALLKELKVKKLVSRAISDLHATVIEAIGVDDVARPESDSAIRYAKKIQLGGVVDSFNLTEDYSIIEVKLPEIYSGKTVQESDFRKRYNLNIITILRDHEEENLIGNKHKVRRSLGVVKPDTIFQKEDTLVAFGRIEDLEACFEMD